jgi:hypothetical protein
LACASAIASGSVRAFWSRPSIPDAEIAPGAGLAHPRVMTSSSWFISQQFLQACPLASLAFKNARKWLGQQFAQATSQDVD